ncbi:hypothetical protein BC936DRAFT_137138 [Jimgerdemannia flammicorona]|uniref:Uncharacterized protein n=1 Tax=Jimgerdemannia flammicorona TaxID=994334 RepID=A0A433CXZ7_9FUNG|nr:hypothetical protein BC936DRAFT_137138 [Jimgerdemannia flammicorona]
MAELHLLSESDKSANYGCLHNLSHHLCHKHHYVGDNRPWGKRLSLPRNVFVRCNIERGFGPLGA